MTDGPDIQLQGWLPGEENNGLMDVAAQLRDAWHSAKRQGENTAQATSTLVVALVKCASVKEREEPQDDVVSTKVVRIEVVRDDADYATVRTILDNIHDKRIGDTPLDGFGEDPGDEEEGDEGDETVESTSGDRTDGRTKKRVAKKAPRRHLGAVSD